MFTEIFGVGKKSNGVGSGHCARVKDVTQGLHGGRTEQRKPAAGNSKGKMKPPFGGQRPRTNSPTVTSEKRDRIPRATSSHENMLATRNRREGDGPKLAERAKAHHNRDRAITKAINASPRRSDSILTVYELADRWGYSPKTIHRWLGTGKLPFGERPVPNWRLDLEDVKAFEKENPNVLVRKLTPQVKPKAEKHVEKKCLPRQLRR